MRRKLLAGFISQTVTHLDRPEIVLLGCFSSFQGDYDEYGDYDECDGSQDIVCYAVEKESFPDQHPIYLL